VSSFTASPAPHMRTIRKALYRHTASDVLGLYEAFLYCPHVWSSGDAVKVK
jgi:hypothetical protein